MRKFTVKDLSAITHVGFVNRNVLKGTKITGVCTDSRTISNGDVFIALKGEKFDGHAFVEQAFTAGAAAAIVDESFRTESVPGKPFLVVPDTTKALGELAAMHRRRFDIPVLAIAGSNGKTTTKEMIVRVLKTRYRVHGTEKNHNNHIGVPQTLLKLQKKHDIAVVEIGTNHPGEIPYLCSILGPTHGLITTIGHEHLEFFKSIDGVADEEGALFEQLGSRKKSMSFVNADNEWIVRKAKVVKNRFTYGLTAKRIDVRGKIIGRDETGCVTIDIKGRRTGKRTSIHLAIPGDHNASNALAATAVGLKFKVPLKKIRNALESFKPSDKRMQVLDLEGVMVYNDTYNANPDSMMAALRTLASANVSGKKIAVLADMRELGEAAIEEHKRVGTEATALGLQYILTYGEMARHIHEASSAPYALHYDQKNMLAEYLAELIAPGDAVLIKGSRGMNMEDIVAFLEKRLSSAVVPFG